MLSLNIFQNSVDKFLFLLSPSLISFQFFQEFFTSEFILSRDKGTLKISFCG